MNIFIRKEYKLNENRVPLIPSDCAELIKRGYNIYVEYSDNRCFSDDEYNSKGCVLCKVFPEDSIIIGLKELNMQSKFFSYKNMYFSHSYKNQSNSKEILKKFKESGGCILDYEYIVDNENKRVIAFGFWAGFSGMYLGLKQYIRKINKINDIEFIKPCNDYKKLLAEFNNLEINPKIAIIGINGRCGKGCKYFLDELNIKYTGFTRQDEKELREYDIIVNCIYLSPESNFFFIDEKNIEEYKNLKVIVDVSCDVHSPNNPIKLKYNTTTFEKPIYRYNNIDIIAIDNLPNLLAKDSSTEFSNKLVKLIQEKEIWDKLENLYNEKIKDI